MGRTLAAYGLIAAIVAPAWIGLESGAFPFGEVLALTFLALLPGLAVWLRRSRAVVAAAILGSTLVAGTIAFDLSLANARPRDSERDFFGPLLSSFKQGFLEFYDTRVPFDPGRFPEMHGAVLVGVFAFLLLGGIAVALRRPFAALGVLVVGAGWPATMTSTWVESSRPLVTGALILGASLVLLVLLSGRRRGLGHAAVAGLVLVAVSVAGSTTDAVAKRGFVQWDQWDFYDRPDEPVDVRYVWDANYDGIQFPKEKTTVLKIKASGPKRSLYWRATTLDVYVGDVWREDLDLAETVSGDDPIDITSIDPLLPEAAGNEKNWVKQEVRVEALEETRLVGSAQAVRWERPGDRLAQVSQNGTIMLADPLRRGDRYTVWSYVPKPGIRELRSAGTDYPSEAFDYLRALPDQGVPILPAFGTPDRDAQMRTFFESEDLIRESGHMALYNVAAAVTGEADNPYEAAVFLEAWFRGEEGGFTYDENPNLAGIGEPPLLAFLREKRGYCQHFAGAMALMLRYVGVPARVAAGFTSGTYDEGKREWTVTDHNAHTWVEVYFPKYGWIPFDPTPNRGQLTASYTPFSTGFDAAEAANLGGALLGVPEIAEQVGRAGGLEGRESGATPDESGGGGVPGAVADTGRSILSLVLLLGLAGAGALLVAKELRRRLRFASRDPRELAGACRRDLEGYVADQGYTVPRSATLAELGALVENRFAVDTSPFVRALTEARYGRPDVVAPGVRRARSELRRLRRRMSRQLGLPERIRGALSVRSLGV
ncbi:MAG: transglutaminase domain-containing protein [Actinobacteria bacterium]|nr:transglutaminase domain-containing protein [Actinomycetota bacterium]